MSTFTASECQQFSGLCYQLALQLTRLRRHPSITLQEDALLSYIVSELVMQADGLLTAAADVQIQDLDNPIQAFAQTARAIQTAIDRSTPLIKVVAMTASLAAVIADVLAAAPTGQGLTSVPAILSGIAAIAQTV